MYLQYVSYVTLRLSLSITIQRWCRHVHNNYVLLGIDEREPSPNRGSVLCCVDNGINDGILIMSIYPTLIGQCYRLTVIRES